MGSESKSQSKSRSKSKSKRKRQRKRQRQRAPSRGDPRDIRPLFRGQIFCQTKKGGITKSFDPRKTKIANLGIWLLSRLGVKRAVFCAAAALSSSPSSRS